MKQNITKEQWDDLDEEQRKNLREYFIKQESNPSSNHYKDKYPYFNIGQLIEFLGANEKVYINYPILNYKHRNSGLVILDKEIKVKYPKNVGKKYFEREELCDSLWEAVKYKLKNNG